MNDSYHFILSNKTKVKVGLGIFIQVWLKSVVLGGGFTSKVNKK